MLDFFKGIDDAVTTQLFGDALHVSFRQVPDQAQWRAWQDKSRRNLLEWTPHRPSIEDVFLHGMNRG